ncbi:hypothetical protein HS960_14415 [Sphingobacterium paramultivorum]|uniref:Uncharacterized protein n=1 Tax=Sphingobacterium paramultivorum TaxID=2886510 RepID=A0A7G5E450_9SPHI|nr:MULTISPECIES: hypothetical protein [Sphingobacterium]MCS4165259.1 hypothetical protein [Sphingobacterium sp. BIGb0116]QMV68775.1 hypothetical protein HS960_14415 [Sphingobacterium paramultivorum]WSO12539.1 hypothetical protein VUL84_14405 [Sphingobacterium paramultivorum]
MEHVKNKSFANNWWLFYPLLFLLIGLLVYALLWNPENTIEVLRQELNDCRDSHAASSTRPVDGGDNTLPGNIDSLQIGELDKNRALPGDDKKVENTIVNCDAKVESGGQGVTKTKHILGDQSGRVILQYDTKTIPDEIKVYYDGKPIAHTDGPVSGAGQLEWIYEVAPGKPKYCYVEVSAPTPRTVWEYIVNCPL